MTDSTPQLKSIAMNIELREACEIHLAMQYGPRRTKAPSRAVERPVVRDSNEAHDLARSLWPDDMDVRERFIVMYFNRANRFVGYYRVSAGGASGTVVDVKLVARGAIERLASAMMLVHNHPSGNLRPSSDDMNITDKINTMCKYMDVSLLDHLILSPCGAYYSFADHGELTKTQSP